jgi:hypothetical protein
MKHIGIGITIATLAIERPAAHQDLALKDLMPTDGPGGASEEDSLACICYEPVGGLSCQNVSQRSFRFHRGCRARLRG